MKEFVEFLAGQPPFDALDPADLQALAATVEVEYFRTGKTLVAAGAEPLKHLYVLRTGSVDVIENEKQIDQLFPGDTFGYDSLYRGLPSTLSLVAAEDTLVYRIDDPRVVLEQPDRLQFRGSSTASRGGELRERALAPVSQYARPLVLLPATASIADTAAAITAAHQSCAVLTFADQSLGIVTDADFRAYLAKGVSAHSEVGSLASRNVLTVPEDLPLANAFLAMVERGVHHLVLTDDRGAAVGVVRVVDLASVEVRDPLVVRAAVQQAGSLRELQAAVAQLPQTAIQLFDASVPPLRVGALLSAVSDAILRKLIEIVQPSAPTEVSWIVLGSLARREVLPASDLDTALVWAEPPDGSDLGPSLRGEAARVLAALETIGLKSCADGTNADTPRFARSLPQWQEAIHSWLRDPSQDAALLLSTMLADSRPITGIELGLQVTEELPATRRSPQFLAALMDYTLASRPPTGFVRDFVVERSGEHRGQLSLKRGGLRPVTSIGRWAGVVTGQTQGTTPERLRRAVTAGLLSSDQAQGLIGAYEQIYGLLLELEIEALRSARPVSTYLAPASLDSLTRRYLRESFRVISAVQSDLETQWQLRTAGI